MKQKENRGLYNAAAAMVLILLIASFVGCYYVPTIESGTAKASLLVKAVPTNVTSIALIVEGPGMNTMAQTVPVADTSVTLEVPAGVGRTFTLLVNTASVSLMGEATVDLQPGETREIVLEPVLVDTQIIVPDFLNNRIVQISDMQGTGRLQLMGSGIAGIGMLDIRFRPYDVDFDAQGRIYIANNVGGSGMGDNCVIRIDDITGSNGLKFSEPEYDYGIVALAVDRARGIVYYAASDTNPLNPPRKIYKDNLDGTGQTGLPVNAGVEPIQTIRGMAVDASGILYIAGNNLAGANRVFRYDPVSQLVTAIYSSNLNSAWDVLVKSPYIYVANQLGADGFKLIQLNPDFTSPIGYGFDAGVANTNPGYFYGPRRFVAILSRKITLIDDREFPDNLDKLVSLDDIVGTNWTAYPASGDGQSLFRFYSAC